MDVANGKHAGRDSYSPQLAPVCSVSPFAVPRTLISFHPGVGRPRESGFSAAPGEFPRTPAAAEIASATEFAWVASSGFCQPPRSPYARWQLRERIPRRQTNSPSAGEYSKGRREWHQRRAKAFLAERPVSLECGRAKT